MPDRAPSPIRLGAALACLAVLPAGASCGSAFCLVNTEWAAQGIGRDAGTSFDLRYETIDLDRPMTGSRRVAVGEIPAHHDEVLTENRNLVASLDWRPSARWALSLVVPYVDRKHEHIHNHRGEKLVERWSFRELGDVRVLARTELGNAESADGHRSWGATVGLKLPTGSHDVANGEGELAERSLQPGTGTTDAVLGAWMHSASVTGWSWFARAEVRAAFAERSGYKPGTVLQLDGGVRRALGNDVAFMAQANAVAKGRDSGAEAEPEDSGQRAIFASPGLSWQFAPAWQAYGFAQFPLWQHVNGVQLTARWSAVAGVTATF